MYPKPTRVFFIAHLKQNSWASRRVHPLRKVNQNLGIFSVWRGQQSTHLKICSRKILGKRRILLVHQVHSRNLTNWYQKVPSLKLTWLLKIDGWKMYFLLGMPIFRGMLVSGSVPSLEPILTFSRAHDFAVHFAGSLPRGCQLLCHFFPLGAVRSILGRSRAAAPSDSCIICDSISQWLFWGVKYRAKILQLDFIQLPLFLFVLFSPLHPDINAIKKAVSSSPCRCRPFCSFLHSRLLARARPVMSDERQLEIRFHTAQNRSPLLMEEIPSNLACIKPL